MPSPAPSPTALQARAALASAALGTTPLQISPLCAETSPTPTPSAAQLSRSSSPSSKVQRKAKGALLEANRSGQLDTGLSSSPSRQVSPRAADAGGSIAELSAAKTPNAREACIVVRGAYRRAAESFHLDAKEQTRSDVKAVRGRARGALIQATESGKLATALEQRSHSAPPMPSQHAIGEIKPDAAATESGELSVASEKQRSRSEPPSSDAKPNAGALRSKAKGALVQATESGRLAGTLEQRGRSASPLQQ